MEYEFDKLILDWIEEYMNTDGYKFYRHQFVEQCINDLTLTYQQTFDIRFRINMEEIEERIEELWNQYCKLNKIPKKSYSSFMFNIKKYMYNAGYINTEEYKTVINQTLEILDHLPQPEQRTPEWYEMRSNLLTATAISKLFFSEARTNSVIYEKCCGNTKPFQISMNDPRHWGQKYEPITREIYETIYHTTIKEYGCIRHRDYPFIGASPDGINIYPHSSKYGRLIEIKNIVNREITCEPSEEYWIQMQIQMEVCDLDICDFVETRIKECTEEEYFEKVNTVEFHGVLLQFMNPLNVYDIHYEYMPLFHTGVIPCIEYIEKWRDDCIQKLHGQYLFLKTLYWFLDEISIVVVLRNRVWFEKALPEISRVWNVIEQERISGYQHRKPKTVLKNVDNIDT